MKYRFAIPPIRCVFGSVPAIAVLLVVLSFGCKLFFPEVEIQIINHAGVAIVGVHAKLSGETSWGENLQRCNRDGYCPSAIRGVWRSRVEDSKAACWRAAGV